MQVTETEVKAARLREAELQACMDAAEERASQADSDLDHFRQVARSAGSS